MNTDTGLLVLRIGVGLIFVFAGWMKVSDLSMTVQMFGAMGLGAFWAYLVSFVELLGGIAVLLGVYTRIASGLLAIVMLVAVIMVRSDMGMMMTPLSLLFSTGALLCAGAGKYVLFRGKCCTGMSGCKSGCCGGAQVAPMQAPTQTPPTMTM